MLNFFVFQDMAQGYRKVRSVKTVLRPAELYNVTTNHVPWATSDDVEKPNCHHAIIISQEYNKQKFLLPVILLCLFIRPLVKREKR